MNVFLFTFDFMLTPNAKLFYVHSTYSFAHSLKSPQNAIMPMLLFCAFSLYLVFTFPFFDYIQYAHHAWVESDVFS